MNFKDLGILIMYTSNRVNGEKFLELMMPRYNDREYIMRLWSQFNDNPCMFMIARNETELFDGIMKEIKDTGYKG